MYKERDIDAALKAWAKSDSHKTLLLRGARQVGKSTAVRHLGEQFESFVEINFDKQKSFQALFNGDLDAHVIASQIANLTGKPVQPGKTLLFFDEIQACHLKPTFLPRGLSGVACDSSRFIAGVYISRTPYFWCWPNEVAIHVSDEF